MVYIPESREAAYLVDVPLGAVTSININIRGYDPETSERWGNLDDRTVQWLKLGQKHALLVI